METGLAQFQILNKVLQTKDLSVITLNNLDKSYFFDYTAEFTFILNHYRTYNVVPDRLTFKQTFPEFDITDVNEPDNFLLSKLSEEYNISVMATAYNTMANLMEKGDVDNAMKLAIDMQEKLKPVAALTATSLLKNTERYNNYLDMAANRSRYFISTGFKELDNILGGIDILNENMVISARTGVGKTWALITMATAALNAGKRVGFYSGEMSVDKVGYRFDTINGKMDNRRISRGDLSYKDTYQKYLGDLAELASKKPNADFLVITPNDIPGKPTVDALKAFIERYNIEILFIDQYSLLESTSPAKAEHEKVAFISKQIKQLQVQKQIPIISVAQMNRSGEKDKETGKAKYQDTTQIGLTDRIGQDATVVLMLSKEAATDEDDDDDETPTYDNVYNFTFRIVKARDGGDNREVTYAWDLNTGEYNYIPSDFEKNRSTKELDAMAKEFGAGIGF